MRPRCGLAHAIGVAASRRPTDRVPSPRVGTGTAAGSVEEHHAQAAQSERQEEEHADVREQHEHARPSERLARPHFILLEAVLLEQFPGKDLYVSCIEQLSPNDAADLDLVGALDLDVTDDIEGVGIE